jgi:hypothetical protein
VNTVFLVQSLNAHETAEFSQRSYRQMGAFPARSRFLFRTYQSIQPKTKALGLSPIQALIYKAFNLTEGGIS